MDEAPEAALQFAVAAQLLHTYGGYADAAWEQAGALMAEHAGNTKTLFVAAASYSESVARQLEQQRTA